MKTAQLTEENKQKLNNLLQQEQQVLHLVEFFLLVIIVSMFTAMVFSKEKTIITWLSAGVVIAISCVAVAVLYYIARQTRRDILNNTKEIVEGIVEEKEERRFEYLSKYILTIQGKKFNTGVDIFTAVKEGDLVRMDVAPVSNTALRAEVIETGDISK